ncbi:MAG: aldo/keto reductase [Lachnospiraceae bacterium]|nr:aldo/keto reductase [Lachnospiraceae bacterium]
MIYRTMAGEKVSLLGFGAMRLPLLEDSKTIDEAQTQKMVDLAIENGVNYFDTAYPYHGGQSEFVMGRALKKYPRESFYLATKYPGHQISSSYDPAEVFEHQLKKCGVDYFDFYLLHNVNESSEPTYKDARWGIMDYFKEQKRNGRIRHLGLSSHGQPEMLEEFLDYMGDDVEFCQIQMNYLDWTLQDAKKKYEMLTARNIPVIVMEPVRGGKLAKLPEDAHAKLQQLKAGASDASWGYRWIQQYENVRVVLSGWSNLAQTEDNLRTFAEYQPLSEAENALLFDIAEQIKDAVPCTSCRYCCDGCPMGLNIPELIGKYNDFRMAASINVSMFIDQLPEDKKPSACIGCGMCERVCPQSIHIPEVMQKFSEMLAKGPNWAEISKQREAEAKAMREGK